MATKEVWRREKRRGREAVMCVAERILSAFNSSKSVTVSGGYHLSIESGGGSGGGSDGGAAYCGMAGAGHVQCAHRKLRN